MKAVAIGLSVGSLALLLSASHLPVLLASLEGCAILCQNVPPSLPLDAITMTIRSPPPPSPPSPPEQQWQRSAKWRRGAGWGEGWVPPWPPVSSAVTAPQHPELCLLGEVGGEGGRYPSSFNSTTHASKHTTTQTTTHTTTHTKHTTYRVSRAALLSQH